MKKHSVGDIDGFVTMLLAACEDDAMHKTLAHLLEQPDQKRTLIVQRLVDKLTEKQAPVELVQAIACLVSDDVAEQAYRVIFQCKQDR